MSFNHFAEIGARLVAACIAIDQKTAQDVVEIAQGNAPVRTGFLRDSIHTEPGEDEFTTNVVAGAYYSIFVELGTRFMAAEPFLFPAVEQGGGIFESNFSELEGMIAV